MDLNAESVGLFIAFVVPGFVSISVYRLIMPSRGWDWSSGLMQGLFYSSLNFIVLLPLILYVATAATEEGQIFFRDPMFVLVHLKSGDLLGGYWGERSHAGSFPNDGDIYLEAVYRVDERRRFVDRIPDTRGVLLTRNEYSYLQLFEVPEEG